MSENTVSNKRIKYLDIAKGISLLLVMISHSCGMPFGEKYFTAFYIQIFFILSGITYTRRTVKENIIRRIKGVIIPYIIYTIIVIALNILLGNLKKSEDMVNVVIGSLYSRYCLYPINYSGENIYFLQIGNSPMWFLTAMFVSSCIFYFTVERVSVRNKSLYIYGLGLIVITILLDKLPILLPWSVDTASLGAFFMLIGYYGKRYYFQKTNYKWLIFSLVLYIACCYFNEGINLSIREYGNYGGISVIAVCIIGIIGSLLCINISKMIERVFVIREIFEFIGTNTILILALHVSIFAVFDRVLTLLGINDDISAVTYYGIGLIRLAVVIGVCFCIQCVKEKWIKRVLMR